MMKYVITRDKHVINHIAQLHPLPTMFPMVSVTEVGHIWGRAVSTDFIQSSVVKGHLSEVFLKAYAKAVKDSDCHFLADELYQQAMDGLRMAMLVEVQAIIVEIRNTSRDNREQASEKRIKEQKAAKDAVAIMQKILDGTYEAAPARLGFG